LPIVDCGLTVAGWSFTINPQSAIRNPQSAIRNPQSAIRNPQPSTFRHLCSPLPRFLHRCFMLRAVCALTPAEFTNEFSVVGPV
jgi:hypothetical protein